MKLMVIILHFIVLLSYGNASATHKEKAIKLAEVCLDVRTDGEFKLGHVKGAVHIPLAILEKNIENKIKDKNTPIFMHCRSGGRSGRAMKILKKLGYKNLVDLKTLAKAKEHFKNK